MENIVLLRCFVFLLALTIGATEIVESETNRLIDICFERLSFDENICSQTEPLRTNCLKEIVPANDQEKMEIENAIKYEENKHKPCSALSSSECIDNETLSCMSHFFVLKSFNREELCNETTQAKKCLLKLNSTCDNDVIKYEVKYIDLVNDQCAKGHYQDGPCSPATMWKCTRGVFYEVYFPGQAVLPFSCTRKDVDRVRKCLTDTREKCTTQYQQRDIADTLRALDSKCPNP